MTQKTKPNETQDRHDEAIKKIWSCRPRLPRNIDTTADIHGCVVRRVQARADYRPNALRNHPEIAPYFKGTPPQQEDILDADEKMPAKQLMQNESITVEIFAQNCWNAADIEVKQGERYEITASGEWKDKNNKASADGYDSNELLKHFEDARRVENKPWFCLIACIHHDAALEAHNPSAGNMLTGILQSLTHTIAKFDRESQLAGIGTTGTLDIAKDGYMYLFANDTPWAYSNNSGYLRVEIKRVA